MGNKQDGLLVGFLWNDAPKDFSEHERKVTKDGNGQCMIGMTKINPYAFFVSQYKEGMKEVLRAYKYLVENHHSN